MLNTIVVGGGIGGAVLASLLSQKGRRVLILEREKAQPRSGRPEILEAATLEVFRSAGVADKVLKEAVVPLRGMEMTKPDGRAFIRFSPEDLDHAHVQPYSTDPVRVREILLEHALARGLVEIRRGVEVTGLLRKDGKVTGVTARTDKDETFEAEHVIGDDGSHSRIRSTLGIPVTLREYPFKFLVPKRYLPVGDPEKRGLARLDIAAAKNGIAGGVFMPIPGGQTALVYLLSQAAHQRFSADPKLYKEAACRMTPSSLVDGVREHFDFSKDFVLIDRPFGHAERYTDSGAAILGDAAHPVTPAGGQGANMSVADAGSLAKALEGSLDSYEASRRAANARSLTFSSRSADTFKIAQDHPPVAWALAAFLPIVAKLNRTRFLRAVGTAFVSGPS